MDPTLRPRTGPAGGAVRVPIPDQQEYLEKHQASGPHRRRAAEPRYDVAGHQGLDLKEQERAQEDRQREGRHRERITPSRAEVSWTSLAVGCLDLREPAGYMPRIAPVPVPFVASGERKEAWTRDSCTRACRSFSASC